MNRLALTLALSLALNGITAAATPIDETRALDPAAQVSLDNLKGRIVVDTWDRAEIRLRGHLGEGTKGLEIDGDERDLTVRVKYPDDGGWFGGWSRSSAESSELLVTLPADVALSIDAVSAEIEVRGLRGRELEIDSVSGDITVESEARDLRIDSVSGDQRVRTSSSEVSLETVSGDVELEGALQGRVSVEAVSGRLRVSSSVPVSAVHAGVVSGDVEIHAALQAGGRITAESLSGDVTLTLGAGSSARVEASSFTGSIRSDVGTVKEAEHGPGSSLSAVVGSGDGRIELESFSGDLRLRVQ